MESPGTELVEEGGITVVFGGPELLGGGCTVVFGGTTVVLGGPELVGGGITVVLGGTTVVFGGPELVGGGITEVLGGTTVVFGGAAVAADSLPLAADEFCEDVAGGRVPALGLELGLCAPDADAPVC